MSKACAEELTRKHYIRFPAKKQGGQAMGNRQNRAPGYIAVIPSEIRYDTALPPSAKLLYGEITALAGSDGYCWATNDYFAQLYGVDKCTISRWISKLQKRGHVTVEVVRGRDGEGAVEERRIYIGRTVAEAAGGIDKKINTYRQKDQEGIDEKVIANKDELTRENIPPIVPQGDAPEKKPRRGRGAKAAPDWKPERFEGFWRVYPVKKSKQAAIRAWDLLHPDDTLLAAMGHALRRQLVSPDWQRKIREEGGAGIPYPSTWLNGRRWEDEEPVVPGPPDGGGERRFGWQ